MKIDLDSKIDISCVLIDSMPFQTEASVIINDEKVNCQCNLISKGKHESFGVLIDQLIFQTSEMLIDDDQGSSVSLSPRPAD